MPVHQHNNHKYYLDQVFEAAISLESFSDDERDIIIRYGCWFQALMDTRLTIRTESQRHFMEVFAGVEPPRTPHEKTWAKYQKAIGKGDYILEEE